MKTTDLLTFFQPEESSGTASTFSVQASDGPALEVWVFAREKVNLTRFANLTVSSEEERRELHQEIHGILQSGGGLLVSARPHNEVVKVQLYRSETPGYVPPKRMLRLSLSGDAQFENITGNLELEIGDHLLLPVSKNAEARLSALRDDLKGLPSDLESSILNIIRRPSLEWRLDRIERTLGMLPATQAERQRSRTGKGTLRQRLYDRAMRQVPIGPVVVAALLLVAGTSFADRWFVHRSQTGRKATSAESNADAVGRATPEMSNAPAPKPAKPTKAEPERQERVNK
jgi:hypothetical protein